MTDTSMRSVSHTLFAGGLCLFTAACGNTAAIGDSAIRTASLGRVQATPFTDMQDKKDCREALNRVLGFPLQSRAMKNGVFVVQTFDCAAERIEVSASLSNQTTQAMYCFAATEEQVYDIYVAPNATARLDYTYVQSAEQDCRRVAK